MKTFVALSCLALFAAGSLDAADAPLVKLRPVPFTDVQIHDAFWATRQEINRTVSIPVNLERPDPGAIKRTLRALQEGAVVGIFPEGPFSREGRLVPGQP